MTLISESVTGILKGYDQLLNLVLDEVQENLQAGGYLPRRRNVAARAHTLPQFPKANRQPATWVLLSFEAQQLLF